MRSFPLVSVLLIAAVMAGAVWWLASGGGPSPEVSPTGTSEAPRQAPTSEPAQAIDEDVAVEDANIELRRVPAPRDPQDAVGRVFDKKGQPVAGAAIACWRKGREHRNATRTDASGAFRIEIPPGRETLRLEVKASGHLRRRVTHAVPSDGGDVHVGALRLRPGAVLAGRVLEPGGRPVAGASVYRLEAMPYIINRRNFEKIAREQSLGGEVTGDDGRFLIEHTRAGPFSLLVGHPDYPATWLLDRTVNEGAVLDDLVVVMRPGSSIRGRLVGMEQSRGRIVLLAWDLSGRGVVPERLIEAQAQISGLDPADPLTTMPDVRRIEVDDDGNFELRAVPANASFAIWALERDPILRRTWRCTQQLEVRAGQVGVVLNYEPGALVTFRVVDAETDLPITRLVVNPRLPSGGGFLRMFDQPLVRPATRTHEEGLVTISGIRPRPGQLLSLDVRARGYQRYRRQDIAVPARGRIDLGTIRLEPKRR